MRVVFLVPRRDDKGHRDELWAWCRRRWETLMPDVPIYEGHHNAGPFNRSAAINLAARLADEDGNWDIAVILDSDVFLPIASVRAAIDSAAAGKITWAHRRWRGFHQGDTMRLIKDPDRFGPDPAASRDMDLIVERTTPISWSCCVAVPRETFDAMGGFDERFVGWGFEDGAWSALVRGLYPWGRIEGDLYHWWHPRSDERIVNGESALTASPDYIRNALLGRRYMVAAIRDHRAGDQPGEERLVDEKVAVHVANLMRDDGRFLRLGRRLGVAEADEWADWWPTLEELQEGAKVYAAELRRPKVTVVVHTGGLPETWAERSGYLRQTLASFTEQVHGPIVQRVIYDCWGDTEIRAELQELGAEHGFYVVGPAVRPDFTGSMVAMWRYLAKRAKGDYIFQIEDDFVFEREVDLEPMIATLTDDDHLVQVALLRDACYPDERETGGILGWPLPAFTFRDGWFEHRQFWTNNPSLFRRSLTAVPWPVGHHSETLFGEMVFKDPAARAAFWGDGTNWIRHIGEVRAGAGY